MTWLPFAAALIAFGAVGLLIYAIYGMATAERQVVAERIRRHSLASSAQGAASMSAETAALLMDKDYSSIDTIDKALKSSSMAERIALDLARADVPLRVGEYMLLRWLLAASLFTIPAFIFHLNLLVAVLLGVIGFYLPRFYVSRKERGRVQKFEDQLVDGLTMMANALKSGSGFLQAIDLVAHEQPAPLSEEFARVVAEANVGASLESSLLELAERVRSYDLYLVVTAMLVQREVGGNLSEVLENIAHTIRERQTLLRQVRVETAEQRLSGYIIGAMPIFMLVMMLVLNPEYPTILLYSSMGQIVLVIAAVMEIIGLIVIERLTKIEI